MPDAGPASDRAHPPPGPRRVIVVDGTGRVCFAQRHGQTRLADLYQSDPIRILFPTPPRGELPTAAFVTTSGGLVGGDRLHYRAETGVGAGALFAAQAAEKVYRSTGDDSRMDIQLVAGPTSWLEWLPQETILFDGARFTRRTTARLTADARMLAGDMVVLGRAAMGETVRRGLIRDEWQIFHDDRLIWADALRLEDPIDRLVDHPAGLDGAIALGMVVYAAPDAGDRLDLARALLADAMDRLGADDDETGQTGDGVRVGASVVNGILLVRLLARQPRALRQVYGEFWARFRATVAGLPPVLPRIWHI